MMGERNILRVNVRLCNSSKCHNSWNVEDMHYCGAPAAFESFHYCLMCSAVGSPWKHKTHQALSHKRIWGSSTRCSSRSQWFVRGQRIFDVTSYIFFTVLSPEIHLHTNAVQTAGCYLQDVWWAGKYIYCRSNFIFLFSDFKWKPGLWCNNSKLLLWHRNQLFI